MSKRRWSREEEQYLVSSYSKINISKIVKHLSRSYPSVKHKAKQLGLERDIYEGNYYFSTGDVMTMFGLAKSTVLYYAKNKYIKCRVLESFNKKYKKFSVENLVNFMLKYPNKWKDRDYDIDMIQLLLLDYNTQNIQNRDYNLAIIKSYIDKPKDYWRSPLWLKSHNILPTLDEKIQAI